MARYGKLREAEVHYVTGMDEHGEKIAQTAVSLLHFRQWAVYISITRLLSEIPPERSASGTEATFL